MGFLQVFWFPLTVPNYACLELGDTKLPEDGRIDGWTQPDKTELVTMISHYYYSVCLTSLVLF